MKKEGTQTNTPEDKKIDDYAQGKRWHRKKRRWKKRRSKRTSQHCMDASIQILEDYIKKSIERLINATKNSTDIIMIKRITTRKQKWNENNYMDISSDKQTKSHVKGLRNGYEKETLREKLNLF